MDSCAGCGFAYDEADAPQAAARIVAEAATLATVLVAPGVDVRRRRSPDTWSPLEYGCHVRDVLLVQRERMLRARRLDRPSFEPMGRDERVDHDGYAEQDPVAVSRQLTDAAGLLANVLDRFTDEVWDRRVVYNYPTRVERSLRWMAVHTVHEVHHHLDDARRQLDDTPRRS